VQQYIAKRILLNIPVVFLVVTIVFLISHLRPDIAERRAAQGLVGGVEFERAVASIRAELGTDKPLIQQYGHYLLDVARGDFGTSLISQRSVLSVLKDRLGTSVELGILQILVGLVISIPIGVISAVRQDTWLDYVLRFFAVLGLAVPSFYMATLLLLAGFKGFGWSPPVVTYTDFFENPSVNLQAMVLPALAGGFGMGAVIMRLLRSQLLEVLRQDFVRTAWAKGLRERTVIARHAMKNALIPVFTIVGLLVGVLFGGNIILETMFALPGIGQYVVISFNQNDLPMIQGIVLLVAIVLVMTNIIVDISYAWLDPRIRYR
jgi:peptide/nickel transport system permease protein